MASTIHRQRRFSCSRVISGVLGCSLLGILLTASLSWAQLPPPPPTPPPPTGTIIFEVAIITPESGQATGSDCFRLDPTTGAFTSDTLSNLGLPSGFWYAFGEPGQPSLFTAHVTALATSSDGQTVPFTVSYGGILDLQGANGGVGAIVFSDGTPFAYQAQMNPSCAVPPPSPAAQGRAPSDFSRHLEPYLGNGK